MNTRHAGVLLNPKRDRIRWFCMITAWLFFAPCSLFAGLNLGLAQPKPEEPQWGILVVAEGGLPNNPDLVYDSITGNVKIDADGEKIVSFAIESAGQFIPPADFSDLDADVGFVSTLTENTSSQMGWTSALAVVDIGFDGPGLADLGNIFPTGLNEAGLQSLLTENLWSRQGKLGSFDLVMAIPEPSPFISLLLAGVFVGAGYGIKSINTARRVRIAQ